MPSLTVWRFPTPYGADQGELRLKMLRDQGALVVHDAATVVWFADAKQPRVRQLKHMRGSDTLGGAFWGTLLGSVFLMPFAGAAVGAAAGALRGRLSDSGIDDRFVAELRDKLTPGTSALFVLSSDADIAKVRARFPENEVELIYADLDEAGAERLRAFEEET
jgi:uncharacterized membrane protein